MRLGARALLGHLRHAGGQVPWRWARTSIWPPPEGRPLQTSQQENSTTSNAEGYDKDAQKEVDARSIYVGNVEYTVDSAELAEFFAVRLPPS